MLLQLRCRPEVVSVETAVAVALVRIAENDFLLRFWMLKSTICKSTHRAWDLFLQVRIIRFVVFVHLRI